DDPILAGALRVGQTLEGGTTALVGVWRRAPLQALARLHALAAADLADPDRLGRPRPVPEISARLDLLTRLVTGGSTVAAPVLAAVAHGELLTLAPFAEANGVVARGVSRLVTTASGLDPHGLGVPEVYWMRRSEEYAAAASGFATGQAEGVGNWLLLCCQALEDGAREAISIAEAAAG
ncbi:MAG: oxidoreductase, partial [Mycobacterium sp.]